MGGTWAASAMEVGMTAHQAAPLLDVASSGMTDPCAPDAGRNFALDVDRVRADFPILSRTVHGQPLIYLDNAASAQKPQPVLDAIQAAYSETYANVHRGAHFLSAAATDAFEAGRQSIQAFLNAATTQEIVFTRGATEAINLVAASWGGAFIGAGDEIILSELEHHANIVPWQMLKDRTGCTIKVAPIDDDGNFDLAAYARLLSAKTKLVAVSHLSNALGTIMPVAKIIAMAHAVGARVLLDGCQAVCHLGADVQALDVDFYVFSGHKLYGPTGIGALYAKAELLEAMPPWQGGGEMIAEVTFAKTTYADLPYKFEAGTPAIAEATAMTAALDYVQRLGLDAIAQHESDLLAYGTTLLDAIPGITIHGRAEEKAAILSFTLAGVHPHDVATLLDRMGVGIRSGHHCAQPLMQRLGVPGTARASFAAYNTRAEVEVLAEAIERARSFFG